MRAAPGQDGWDYGRSWLGVRLPAYLQAPAEPLVAPPLAWQGATPAQFTRRVLLAAPRYIVPGGVLTSIDGVCTSLLPIIAGRAIDDAIRGQDLRRLIGWLTLLGAVTLVGHLSYRFGSRMGFFGMQTVQHRLRTQVTDRLLDPAGVADKRVDGAALSIATADVATLSESMRLLIYPVGAVVSLAFSITMLWLMAWPLGLTALLGALLLPMLVMRGGRPLQRRVLEQQQLAGDSVGMAADLLTGYRVIKGVRAEAEAANRYRATSRDALGGTLRTRRAEGIFFVFTEFAGGLMTTVLVVMIGVLALRGELSVGQVISAVGLIAVIAGPVSALGENVGAIWAEGCACAQRVLSVLQAPTLRGGTSDSRGHDDGDDGGHASGDDASGDDASGDDESGERPGVQQDAVAGDEETALSVEVHVAGLDVVAAAGECVGIDVDQRTAGRLVQALAARGEDGATVSAQAAPGDMPSTPDDLGLEAWRRQVVVAPHRGELFDGTVRWNLDVPGAREAIAALLVEPTPGAGIGRTAGAAASDGAALGDTARDSRAAGGASGGETARGDDVTDNGAHHDIAGDDAPVDDAAADNTTLGNTPRDDTAITGTVCDTPRPDDAAFEALMTSALHAAACDDVIANLDEGWDAEVGEGGHRLSGGQRQRIALARAYAAQAPVLVLHDPTTAVDTATESLVAQRLRGIRGERTTMVVTSSPALLSVCDRVVRGGSSTEGGGDSSGAPADSGASDSAVSTTGSSAATAGLDTSAAGDPR